MGEDWKAGDLALCVNAQGKVFNGQFRKPRLAVGAVYTVSSVVVAGSQYSDAGQVGLHFEEVTTPKCAGGFHSNRFRKIRPHTEDEQDRETIRLLTQVPETVDA